MGAVAFGLLLIVVLTPLSQFLTLGLNNSDLETAAPVGWAIGLLVSVVLVTAVCRLISRYRLVGKQSLVLIYCMLTVAVPMMNMGMARGLFATLRAVQEHYVGLGVNTYRTAYLAESPRWFPVVPTTEGLAWNQAERLLQMLSDPQVVRERQEARRELLLGLNLESKRLSRSGAPLSNADVLGEKLQSAVLALGPDESVAILKDLEAEAGLTNGIRCVAESLGVLKAIEEQTRTCDRQNRLAEKMLATSILEVDEESVAYVDAVLEGRSRSESTRFLRYREMLSPEERAALDQRAAQARGRFGELRKAVAALSHDAYSRVRSIRAGAYEAQYAGLEEDALGAIRAGFIYRSSGEERKQMYRQNGRQGTPNQNLQGFSQTLWVDADARRVAGDLKPLARWQAARKGLPWNVWLAPMLHWGMLITAIYLFLMCLAEWLRRKWVDRENLAFPLVEVADNIIRHDYDLEHAEDIRSPSERSRPFALFFWVGFALGALLLLLEALGHYGMAPGTGVMTFDLSTKVFTDGFFRHLDNVVFLISPIAVGLLFLVSLEVSFSVWVIYLVFRVAFAVVSYTGVDLRDDIYTGWAGGRAYPFMGEQLVGACIALSVVALFKTWYTMRRDRTALPGDHGAYVNRRLATLGLVVMPLAIGWMLWDLGVTNVPFMAFFGAIAILLAIASARVRAETGLPQQHMTYEFSKLPLVFGLTGLTGARVYTVFISLAFLPVTLLFRLLPQQLENIELARRNRVKYGTVATAGLLAFLVALAVGMASLLVMAYFKGGGVLGEGDPDGKSFHLVSCYPLWVSHFLGESGLETFTRPHAIRIWFMGVGAAIFVVLLLCRQRFMKFPLNPLGYVLVLLSTFFPWVTPYFKTPSPPATEVETSWLWGSAFVAWLVKKLIIKYGGMNTYKRTKPLFIGLVVGAIFCVFVWNVVDLAVSLKAEGQDPSIERSGVLEPFLSNPAFNPRAY